MGEISTIYRSYLKNKLIVNEKDGTILALVPAGEFEMGDGEDSSNPRHAVYLDAYYIGVCAVTNRQYKKFVDETGHRPPDESDYSFGGGLKWHRGGSGLSLQAAQSDASFGGGPKWKGSAFPPELSDHPVVCVSWDDARAYCRWAGLELPTEAQWEKAARGPSGQAYPWGDEWDSERCRHYVNRGGGETCRVYDYAEGASGYGAYNMSGNVWEWCLDRYGSDYYKKSPNKNPTGPASGSIRVLRGGSWNCDSRGCRAAGRGGGRPSYRIDGRGFRAVLAPGQQP